jgi:outer membrane receptor for ferric coprogen and ferric-rhodotorulic acid
VRTFDRERFGPITGTNKEVGIKGNFWRDRGNISLSAFNIDRQNVALSYNGCDGDRFHDGRRGGSDEPEQRPAG